MVDNISAKLKKITVIGLILGIIGGSTDFFLVLSTRGIASIGNGVDLSSDPISSLLYLIFGPILPQVGPFKLSLTNTIAILLGIRWVKETLPGKIFYGVLAGLLVMVFGLITGGIILMIFTAPGIDVY